MVSDKGKRQTNLLFLILVAWCTCTNPGWISMFNPSQSVSHEFFVPTEAVLTCARKQDRDELASLYLNLHWQMMLIFITGAPADTDTSSSRAVSCDGALARSSCPGAPTWALLNLVAPWQIKIGLQLQPSYVRGEGAASLACYSLWLR